MPFTLTDIHNLWPRSVFKQYFDDWLASFKQQDGNFFSKRKKIISQQTGKKYCKKILWPI